MPITINGDTFADFASAVRSIMKSKGLCKDKASALVATIARKQGDIEAIEHILHLKKAVEQDFTGTPSISGSRVHGRLAHAGWSRNGRVYSPGVLAAVPATLPIILNHATIEGTDGIPDALLPESYKVRLRNGEDIILGQSSMRFIEDTLELVYDGEVTDPHFKRKEILQHMNVSLGLLFEGEKMCDQLACYDVITEPLWREMSLVFSPGFASATLSTERDKRNGSLSAKTPRTNYMSNDIPTSDKIATEQEVPSPDQAGMPDEASGGCPEGMQRETESGNCVEVPKENPMSSPQAPDVIDEVTEQVLNDDDDDDDDKDKKKDTQTKKSKEQFIPKYTAEELNSGVWKDNADLKSERARTVEYYRAIKKAQAYGEAGQIRKGNEVLEAELQRLDLTSKLRAAKEKARPRAMVPKAQSANQATELNSANEYRMPSHAYEWFKGTLQGKDITPSKRYSFNKQYIYENHPGRFYKTQKRNPMGNGYEMELIPMTDKQRTATEVLTGPAAADFMQTMSEQVIVDPNGQFTTPIRQFCDTLVLAPGQREGLFYDLDKVSFNDVAEGTGPTSVPEFDVNIRSAGGNTSPRGALVNINYSQVEELPFDVVAKLNEGYALESVIDETFDAVNTAYNDDTPAVAGDRLPKGGGVKTGRWVNGNTGEVNPDDTAAGLERLTIRGLLSAKKFINLAGFRTPNKVTYLSEQGIEDLILDPNLDQFLSFSRPQLIEEGDIERVVGTNLISSSELPLDGTGNANVRAVMFVPNVTFGLVTGRDLTMEAQRRNEEQVIKLTGTQKIAAFVKKPEASCRISYQALSSGVPP